MSEQPKDPRNTGHGWVNERPDGMKAKCGGPGLCATCKAEKEALKLPALGGEPETLAVFKADGSALYQTKAGFERQLTGADIELVDRSHVTRLQAEVERLNAEVSSWFERSQDEAKAVESLRKTLPNSTVELANTLARNAELEGLLREVRENKKELLGAWVTQDWYLRRDAALAERKCCAPTPEERAALAAGDATPEELWGGSSPSCPKCHGNKALAEGKEHE